MSIIEKVGIFVYVLAHGATNRLTQERFQHSGKTVSQVFKEVLYAMDGISRDILIPRDPNFKEVPRQLENDARYLPYFKDCIGAMDGTHISIIVPEEDQLRYRGRKGIPTTNVLAVCDVDLLFTCVLTGWEGSAHDSRIFLDTIGKYYVVDKSYPKRMGYLTPYPKTRRISVGDPAFRLVDKDPNFVPPEGVEDIETNVPQCVQESSTREMTIVKNMDLAEGPLQ
ncbi:uncharacterized protein LOC110703676 [Chenopodium quinoa]|uniref:uncharacterized protein LOC110703676 n=1 Tax=Chenopodium quinoa TaxID=63459 RepID=UPI000B780B02|nr:uncharacterized protein LOC110703676 [Chenopodium quinoa]